MVKTKQTKKKVWLTLAVLFVLVSCFAITTYALAMHQVSVEDNAFEMARIRIELNDGKAIFDGSDMNIEPGYSIKKDFTIENKSTVSVYYRLYLENVTGTLPAVLNFEIYDGDKLLFSGNANDLTRDNPCVGEDPLEVGEIRTLTAVVKMAESAGNAYQMGDMAFDVTVDAVQARNNTEKQFE